MAWLEPGHFPIVMLTPEEYDRMRARMEPNLWPVYFGARYAAQAVQDLAFKAMQAGNIDVLKGALDIMIPAGLDVATEQAMAGPEGDIRALKDDIKRLVGGLYDNWKAGIWHGVGGAYSGAMDDFIASGQLIYAYKTLAYHCSITPRMRRYWNRLFTPMVPAVGMAWVLYRRKHFTRDQFDLHAAWEGWDKEGADLLVKAMNTLPSPREAFYLWMKGQITEEQRNALYYAHGWDEEWWAKQTENWYYVPTLYDLTRIADYVELDQIWALDAMKRRGVSERDRAKMWEMLEIRPIRDEIRKKTTHAVYCRQHGFWSKTKFESFLADMAAKKYIRPREKDLLTQYGEDLYEQELKEEWVEILRWRFRTALISEEEFLNGLTDPEGPVAMQWEKANLIVELEKAKGYYGYY